MVKMISDVYVPIEYLELRVSRQDLIWRSFRDGRREGIRQKVLCSEETVFCDYIESQYYNNLGGNKAKKSSKGGNPKWGIFMQYAIHFRMSCRMLKQI